MTLIKVCGVTRPADAVACVERGVDWLGLNFWPEASRGINRLRAREVAAAARSVRRDVVLVGVFVNQPAHDIESVIEAARLDLVQLHGDESPELVGRFGERAIKAIRLEGEDVIERMERYPCRRFLLDTPSAGYGGSGVVGNWELAARVVASSDAEVMLAGGLAPHNVSAAVEEVRPFAVDVATGVEERPGIKDPRKVAAFVAAVREAG